MLLEALSLMEDADGGPLVTTVLGDPSRPSTVPVRLPREGQCTRVRDVLSVEVFERSMRRTCLSSEAWSGPYRQSRSGAPSGRERLLVVHE